MRFRQPNNHCHILASFSAASLLALAALGACSSSSDAPSNVSTAGGGGGATTAAHWEYSGEDGPEHWAELSDTYATCETGLKQSPIEIPAKLVASPGKLEALS